MDKDKTSIRLTAAESQGKKGVFFGISRNGIQYRMPLTIGDCTIIAEYCRFFLNKLSETYFQMYMSNQPQQEKKPQAKPTPSILDPETEDEVDNLFDESEVVEEDPFDSEKPF